MLNGGVHQIEFLHLRGECTLYAWKKGVIPQIMHGAVYQDARKYALEYGYLQDVVRVKNLVVNIGRNLVADWAIDVEPVGLAYHAIGTGVTVPAVTDTIMTNEVKRKAWTTRARTLAVVTMDVFYLAAESTYFIKECGVFGGTMASLTPGSGTMFSHFLLSYDNSGGSNDLTFEYQLTIS